MRRIILIFYSQSIQAAVDQQMESLARTHPSQRVALITFNDEVCKAIVNCLCFCVLATCKNSYYDGHYMQLHRLQ